MKILVVEDDPRTRKGLLEILANEGYETCSAANGSDALTVFAQESPDVLCLDIMMPGLSGYDVCREIRKTNSRVPILFISAKSEEVDKVLGLELGADDYISKPFGVKEVVARIRAVTRRCLSARPSATPSDAFAMGDLRVVPTELRVYRGKHAIEVSLRDMRILHMLHENRGRVLDRNAIFDTCWGLNYMPNSRSLDQHISQLRKRIEVNPAKPRIILTVHNAGYRYDG
ncbi:MAG: response regulator transcription factor [Planctomycetes bacterium]|nr:response regulator transcription factor [Planctomycetota bacterium]